MVYAAEEGYMEKGENWDSGENKGVVIQEVRLVVPETDDTSQMVFTFRALFLGLLSCVVLSFLNMFFSLRNSQLSVDVYCAQILALPLGKAMALTLPDLRIGIGRFKFSLNPGPFTVKEHVLITVFASAGSTSVFSLHAITVLKGFYHRNLSFVAAVIVTLTIQLMGYGYVGAFRKLLIEPSHMWWPSNLVQVSLYRAMHEQGGHIKFFLIALFTSFAYYWLPGYLFTILSSISWVCYLWPNSVLANQLGSGTAGLGLGAIGLDWSTIAGFLKTPLATPFFAIVNVMVGFIVTLYVLVPVSYWGANLFEARRFPIFSKKLFAFNGKKFNHTIVVTDDLRLNEHAYETYSHVYLSIIFVFTYAAGFALITSSVVHVLLNHGREFINAYRRNNNTEKEDIHTKLMRAYKPVPQWWFCLLNLISLAASLFVVQFYKELQFPWWGVLLAVSIGFILTLPLGVIYATTNQLLSIVYFFETTFGFISPGRPIGTLLFRGYGYTTLYQALGLLSDLKLGHYMKIPPRSMFIVQVLGSAVAGITYLSVGWWLLETQPNICDSELKGNPWTCPHDEIFYDGSIIWGLIGPRKIMGPQGFYRKINYAFLFGALAPFPAWLLSKYYPHKTWLKKISIPVMLSAASRMPYAAAVNFWSWFLVGFIFNYLVFKYKKDWWKKHNYVLSGALDAGVAFATVLIAFGFTNNNVEVSWWGSRVDEQCPLATCPTAPGVKVKGCPVF